MAPSASRTREADTRWNMTVNLVDLVFFSLGASLVSRETVLPLLVSRLTDSTVALGLIPAVHSLAFYLPQLIGARVAASMPLKKPFVALWGGLGERLPYLLAGAAIFLLAVPAPLAAFAALAVLIGISGGSSGFAMPAWFDMFVKVIPIERRGLLTGAGFGLGALLGVAGAAVIGLVLERVTFPYSYALLYLLASVALAVSWVGLVLNREPPSSELHPEMPLGSYLRGLPHILRRDANFRRFLLAAAVTRTGVMASGFLLVYGATRFRLGGAEVGLLTGVLIGAQAVLNPLLGFLGDRRGHKVVLVSGGAGLALAAATVAIAPDWPWLALAFALLGVYLAADSASFLTILPEFCAEADRPTYIGLTNTLLTPVTALAPLLGGVLASLLGYPPMLAIATLAAGLGAALMALWVREPRRHSSRGAR